MPSPQPLLCMSDDHRLWYAFVIDQAEVIIGRDPDADFVLERANVSRFHARIHMDGTTTQLEDLESSNGTWLDRRRIRAAVLADGAVFRVGPTLFAFARDPQTASLPDGRRMSMLEAKPLPRPARVTEDAPTVAIAAGTVHLDPEMVKRMLEGDQAWGVGALIEQENQRRHTLGSKTLHLGWRTDIPVDGWGYGGWSGRGHGATVRWQHDHHVIERNSWLATLNVNGVRVERRRLRHGDRVLAGRTSFRYVSR